jgi:hypothetical protein
MKSSSPVETLPMKRLCFLIVTLVFLAADHFVTRDLNNKIFFALNLVHSALDFPATPEHLENCIKCNDWRCLRILGEARQAKKQLFSVSHQDALALTLGAIDDYCSIPEADHGIRCAGAVTALGFFTSKGDDEKIVSFFSKSREVVLRNIFMMDAEWLSVRSDKSIWEKWVNSSSLDNDTKRQLINLLQAKKPEHLSIDIL